MNVMLVGLVSIAAYFAAMFWWASHDKRREEAGTPNTGGEGGS
ncbi:hypothetical protein [Nocardiopsis salina]|nr:hypothetical protein [Nocardiopsis salina]